MARSGYKDYTYHSNITILPSSYNLATSEFTSGFMHGIQGSIPKLVRLIRGEPERAPNTGETYGNFAVPMYLSMYLCMYVSM